MKPPIKPAFANIKPGQKLTLAYRANIWQSTFLGFSLPSDSDSKDDTLAKFRDADGMEWEAYKHNGRWVCGSSADRLILSAPAPAFPDADYMHIIEKSGIRKGEYIAYVKGVQRIRKSGGFWESYSLGSMKGEFIPASAPTLKALAAKLALA